MKTTFPLLLFALLTCSASAQTSGAWQKTYPHPGGASRGRDVVPAADGGYFLVGEVDFPTGAIRHYIRLVKTDSGGEVLWERTYKEGEIAFEAGNSVRELPDGSLAIGGKTLTVNGFGSDFYLLRTKANGDTLFSRAYPGIGGFQQVHLALPLPGGDILLAGEVAGIDSKAPRLLRVRADGSVIWEHDGQWAPLGGTGAVDAEITPDGHFLFPHSLGNDVSLTELDGASGDKRWSRAFQLSKTDLPAGLCPATDGSGFAVAATGSGFAGFSPLVFKVSDAGVLGWSNMLSLLGHFAHSIEPAHGGGYILGTTWATGGGPTTSMFNFVKTSDQGELLWAQSYAGSLDYFRVKPTPDGGYIGIGTRGADMLLLKTDGNGEILSAGPPENPGVFSGHFFPNPALAGEPVFVDFENLEASGCSGRLFDAAGRLVFEKVFLPGEKIGFDAPPLPGTYFFELRGKQNRPLGGGRLAVFNR